MTTEITVATPTAAPRKRSSSAEPRETLGSAHKPSLTYRLLVLSNTLGKGAVRFYARRFGVTLAEWRFMAVLALHPPLSVNTLSIELSVDKGWISRTAAALIKKGLVSGGPDHADRRKLLLTLTAAGKARYAKIAPEASKRQGRLLSALIAEEQQIFEAVLEKLQRRASDMLAE